jgi:photosystem II stability/assembly factor-like uncharacterized protein
MDQTNHNVLYFSVDTYEKDGVIWLAGLIYKSTNAGNSWIDASSGLPVSNGFHPSVYSICSDPVNSGVAYAGVYGWSGVGIYKTTNAGLNWYGLPNTNWGVYSVRSIALDPQNSDYMYVGTDGGLFVSTDAGANWNKLYPSENFWSVTVEDQASVVYAGNTGAVYKSEDRGTSWTRYTDGLPSGRNIWALAVDPLSPNRVFAVAYEERSIYVSVDRGVHWEERKLKYYYNETLPALSIALSPE